MATDYQKVTSTADLVAGAKYVIGTDAGSFISTESYGNNRKITTTTVTDGVVTATEAMMVFTLGGQADAWTFATDNYLGTAGYLNATSTTGSNYLKIVADLDNYAYFTVAIADGVTTITCNGKESRHILYQNGTTCFACYNNQTGSQYHKPNLYKEVAGGGEEETHTYTVAGEPATLFGSNWDETDTNNDMVKQQDGTYKWEKTDVTLSIGTIAFKVVKDHAWGEGGVNAYPASNYELNIAEAGEYTVTIIFNPAAEENKISAEAVKTGDAEVDDTAVLGIGAWGNEQDWSQADMVLSGDKSYATITKTLTAGDYRFKTVINGGWRSNAYVYHRDFRAAAGISGNEYLNMKLQADVDGDYIFNWFFANDSLEIIFPEVDPDPQPSEAQVIYNWSSVEAENVGVTINGGNGVTFENVKIHENSDNVPGIKFGSSYVYADGKWIAIKPAEGGFLAGDKVNIAVCYNNKDEKQAQIKAYAADGATELFLTANGINGRTSAADLVVETFTLAADQDSILLGRYGNTGTFITTLKVTREGGDTPEPPVEPDVYTVAGSSQLLGSNWATADEANDMTYNSETGIYTLVKENVELAAGNYDYKVVKDHDWGDGEYPTSGNNTLNIPEDGVYTVTFSFNPAAEENKLTAIAEKTGEAEIEHVYTVVGVEALIGYNWEAGLNAPENEMTSTADDLYTLVKENITLAANSYEYQVADNHDWRNVPNSVLEISQSGIYNVTFTFVPSTGATNAEAALQEAIDVDPTAELGIGAWGNEQDWSQADMVLSGDKSYATITKTLTVGDYRFKTVINGGWRSNGYTYHRGFPAAEGITDNNDNNMKLQADVDGDYIFKWTFETNALEITFPAAVAPTAAPAEPTPERYQVKAVYAAKYEADCNFGEWSSGTQYAQEEYGKKYVTNNMGYFGLEFTGKNCSEMEYLHLDVWAASDIAFRVVPIHHGTEVGVTVNIEGQKWNAIDIALSEFAGVTDWSDVYQIKIDNAANLTFWLNNVYFYTTQTKTVDLVDGYYLIGTMNDWEIHNITAAHLFAVNPDNDAEYKLTYTLADGDNFKVVAVANNELGAWYPAEGDNYVVDFAHAGERDIYFRPDYQGGEDWHVGCIYVAPDADASPWETWFAIGDTWNTETQSYLDWDAENGKATVHINVSKYGQWRAQVKYHGPIAEEGKCYHVALKLKANHALNGVTIKWQDTPNEHPIVIEDQSVNLAANTEYVFDATGKAQAVNVEGGNGIMVLDFGWALEGDIIEIYDVVIEEVECPVLEPTYYLVGSMNAWNPNGDEQYLFTVNPDNEGELMLNCTLTENDIFKVVETTSNSWFPAEGGEASNYVVDAAHAGDVTIYFRPDYQGGEGWHYGCIYVDVHTGTAISNTAVDAKAEKILRNGMILIVKGDKTYNVMGQRVK